MAVGLLFLCCLRTADRTPGTALKNGRQRDIPATKRMVSDTNQVKEVNLLNVQEVTPFFEKLYEETYDSTLLYLTRRCGDPAQIPDLMQEVYAEVYAVLLQKGPEYFRRPRAFVQHVAKARLCRYYSLRRRLACLVSLDRFGTEDAGEGSPPREIPDQDLPENLAEDKLLAGEIAARLKTFPADVQRIFICHFWLDMPLSQTAKALGMKEATVKSKLYRTLAKLRELYQKDGAES